MKVLSIGGTRPQFVKMAVIVKAFDEYNSLTGADIEHRLLHTGQHYDSKMSEIFFDELGMPAPYATLSVHAGPPGMQTASMLASIEASLKTWTPDAVLIYGDTNSTLASALAVAKMQIPLIHLESGLRSFNRRMQEEINRIVSDHVSDLLLCPTQTAQRQLETEGLGDRAVFVGDVMLDAVAIFSVNDQCSQKLRELSLCKGDYALVTLHRAETTDDVRKVGNVIRALEAFPLPVILPLHPRFKRMLGAEGLRMLSSHPHIHVIDSVGYQEMLILQQKARVIATDSGGLQKEAYFIGTPCVTMRDETEWPETLDSGWNRLVGTETDSIVKGVKDVLANREQILRSPRNLAMFGSGTAGMKSVQSICTFVRGEL
jgi:UDP-GlcNAc3NAcA epimerase